ncbi:MAG TPA: WecB/TagA/CpsF family glycosyltransferase [Opitutaceae bacterium]|nr:WecB/TagA/CpsF family glycosyltransferase [Opitutaceae bacterium]
MPPVSRYNVLGVGISAVSLDQACRAIVAAKGRAPTGYVCATGVHGVSEAQRDPAVRRALNGAWLNVPDGMPLVWLGRAHGHRGVTRVYGPDLMLAVCGAGRADGLAHHFFGGGPGVAETLRDRLSARFPDLRVVGTFTPPFRALHADEAAAFRADVAAKRPDVIWVGLSTPTQELFMAEHWRGLDAAVMVGVGAAFDFHAGLKPQAPRWMQRSGLEWLFRLAVEPRRLWRRYLVNNPLFVARVLLQASGLRRYPLPPSENS